MLSILLILSGILEHSQIEARYLIVPEKLLTNLKLGDDENGELDQKGPLSNSISLNKRGPEVFIPFMEANGGWERKFFMSPSLSVEMN